MNMIIVENPPKNPRYIELPKLLMVLMLFLLLLLFVLDYDVHAITESFYKNLLKFLNLAKFGKFWEKLLQ